MSWFENAVVYQVYPRSFADANGDGQGDLAGVRARLDHLVDLGADAVWLSPFYPSPQKDSGYDVSDYTAIDPRYGTLGDFDALVAAADEAGLRVIVDIVPNHCSVEHPLFQAALAAAPGSPEREMFHFADAPNNWPSMFGGAAWTQVPDGQWYLHLFDSSQPDWNWRNPAVAEMFEGILRFWLDRGAAGFRIDVGNALYKTAGLPDLEAAAADEAGSQGSAGSPYLDQPELDAHYASWRALLDGYGDSGFPGQRILIGETWTDDPGKALRWIRAGMHQSFDFRLIGKPWDAAVWQETVDRQLRSELRPGESPWAVGNHDVVRLVTRLGVEQHHDHEELREALRTDLPVDRELGVRRARAAALFLLGLPGSMYVYQGDELGLPEYVDLPDDRREDPMFLRNHGRNLGRDGCRVPIPWSGTAAPYGFGPGAETWLPQPGDWQDLTVEAADRDPGSVLNLYRAALRERRELTGDLVWDGDAPDVVSYTRGAGFRCVTNFGSAPVELPVHTRALASAELVDGRLPGDAAAWLWD